MIRLPEIQTADLSTYGNFAKCHQAHFHIPRVGLGTRLASGKCGFTHGTNYGNCKSCRFYWGVNTSSSDLPHEPGVVSRLQP